MQKLICFDLDGTLTPGSTWALLNARLGITKEEDSKLFEEYLKEKFDYRGWMDALVALYKARTTVTKQDLLQFAETIELRPEALSAISNAKEKGYTVAIISGSIDLIVEHIATTLGVEVWFAKTQAVWSEHNELIGLATTQDGERDEKLHQLESYCAAHSLALADVICVEDGGNGLELFKHCKGILLGDNKELIPFTWKRVENLSEVNNLI